MTDFITVRQLAKRLDVSERTIRAWEASGRLPPAYHTSKRWVRFKLSEVERLMDQRRAKA